MLNNFKKAINSARRNENSRRTVCKSAPAKRNLGPAECQKNFASAGAIRDRRAQSLKC